MSSIAAACPHVLTVWEETPARGPRPSYRARLVRCAADHRRALLRIGGRVVHHGPERGPRGPRHRWS